MEKIPKCQHCKKGSRYFEVVTIEHEKKFFCDTCADGLRIEKEEEKIKKAESKGKIFTKPKLEVF